MKSTQAFTHFFSSSCCSARVALSSTFFSSVIWYYHEVYYTLVEIKYTPGYTHLLLQFLLPSETGLVCELLQLCDLPLTRFPTSIQLLLQHRHWGTHGNGRVEEKHGWDRYASLITKWKNMSVKTIVCTLSHSNTFGETSFTNNSNVYCDVMEKRKREKRKIKTTLEN